MCLAARTVKTGFDLGWRNDLTFMGVFIAMFLHHVGRLCFATGAKDHS